MAVGRSTTAPAQPCRRAPASGTRRTARTRGPTCVSSTERPSVQLGSTAAHAVAAVQALVTGAVADRDVTAAVAHRSVAHHFLELRVERAVRLDHGLRL